MGSLYPRILFYPSLAYNVVMSKYAGRHWYDRIDETVILGALPFRSWNKSLLSEKVCGIVTLNEPYETRFFVNTKEEWASMGITQLTLSTPDMIAAPTQNDIRSGVQFIMENKERGDSVYVHCKAGRTRSATVVACYLMQLHGCCPQEAVNFIQEKRPHIKIRSKQWEALEIYYKTNVLSGKK